MLLLLLPMILGRWLVSDMNQAGLSSYIFSKVWFKHMSQNNFGALALHPAADISLHFYPGSLPSLSAFSPEAQ